MSQIIEYQGTEYEFPDDASDQQIASYLKKVGTSEQEPPASEPSTAEAIKSPDEEDGVLDLEELGLTTKAAARVAGERPPYEGPKLATPEQLGFVEKPPERSIEETLTKFARQGPEKARRDIEQLLIEGAPSRRGGPVKEQAGDVMRAIGLTPLMMLTSPARGVAGLIAGLLPSDKSEGKEPSSSKPWTLEGVLDTLDRDPSIVADVAALGVGGAIALEGLGMKLAKRGSRAAGEAALMAEATSDAAKNVTIANRLKMAADVLKEYGEMEAKAAVKLTDNPILQKAVVEGSSASADTILAKGLASETLSEVEQAALKVDGLSPTPLPAVTPEPLPAGAKARIDLSILAREAPDEYRKLVDNARKRGIVPGEDVVIRNDGVPIPAERSEASWQAQTFRTTAGVIRAQPEGAALADALVGLERNSPIYARDRLIPIYRAAEGLSESDLILAKEIVDKGARARIQIPGKDPEFLFKVNEPLTPQVLEATVRAGESLVLEGLPLERQIQKMQVVERVRPLVMEWHRTGNEMLQDLRRYRPGGRVVTKNGEIGIADPYFGLDGWGSPQKWLGKLDDERISGLVDEVVDGEKSIASKADKTWTPELEARIRKDATDRYTAISRDQDAIAAGQAVEGRQSSVDFHRNAFLSDGETPLPGAEKNLLVSADRWVRDTSKAIQRARYLGQEDTFLNESLGKIKNAGGNYKTVERYAHLITDGPIRNLPVDKMVREMNAIEGFRHLGLKTLLVQPSVLANVAAEASVGELVRAIPNSLRARFGSGAAKARAETLGLMGKYAQGWMEAADPALAATRGLRYGKNVAIQDPGFFERLSRWKLEKIYRIRGLDNSLRGFSAEVGIKQGEDFLKQARGETWLGRTGAGKREAVAALKQALPGRRIAGETVEDIIARGYFTNADLIELAASFETNTNFRALRSRLPAWVSTPYGSIVTFLGKYPIQQTGYVWNGIIKPYADTLRMVAKGQGTDALLKFARANMKLTKFAIGYGIFGEYIGDMRAAIDLIAKKHEIPTWEEVSKKRKLSPGIDNLERWLSNFVAAGTLGIVTDAFGRREWHLEGPVMGAVSDVAGTVYQAGKAAVDPKARKALVKKIKATNLEDIARIVDPSDANLIFGTKYREPSSLTLP